MGHAASASSAQASSLYPSSFRLQLPLLPWRGGACVRRYRHVRLWADAAGEAAGRGDGAACRPAPSPRAAGEGRRAREALVGGLGYLERIDHAAPAERLMQVQCRESRTGLRTNSLRLSGLVELHQQGRWPHFFRLRPTDASTARGAHPIRIDALLSAPCLLECDRRGCSSQRDPERGWAMHSYRNATSSLSTNYRGGAMCAQSSPPPHGGLGTLSRAKVMCGLLVQHNVNSSYSTVPFRACTEQLTRTLIAIWPKLQSRCTPIARCMHARRSCRHTPVRPRAALAVFAPTTVPFAPPCLFSPALSRHQCALAAEVLC